MVDPKERLKKILGDKADNLIQRFAKISPDFAHYVEHVAYGDFYARPGFNDKLREFAAVACMMGQGNTGVPLKAHLQGMLNVGWKKEEIIELIIFLICFVGFPTCVDTLLLLEDLS